MENASKALLIAAGVLVVILIIAVSMRVFNSTNDITDDAYEVGESIETETLDASKGAISALKDITSKNLINVSNKRFRSNGSYYSITATGFYIEPGKEYNLQFDYDIEYADYTVGCGIGIIRNGYYLYPDYSSDIKSFVRYPNQDKGTFSCNFKATVITQPTELGIRFIRMNARGKFNVYISNVELREVK